jgi:hypothetical protein
MVDKLSEVCPKVDQRTQPGLEPGRPGGRRPLSSCHATDRRSPLKPLEALWRKPAKGPETPEKESEAWLAPYGREVTGTMRAARGSDYA